MSGFEYSDWSYDPFENLVIFPPDLLAKAIVRSALSKGRWEGVKQSTGANIEHGYIL